MYIMHNINTFIDIFSFIGYSFNLSLWILDLILRFELPRFNSIYVFLYIYILIKNLIIFNAKEKMLMKYSLSFLH